MEASPSEFLCENCGYPLRDLAGEVSCPECGRAIGESDPACRVGTAWQRRPSPDTWLTTSLAVFLRPGRLWSRARVEWRRAGALLVVNVTFAGLLSAGLALAATGSGWGASLLGGLVASGVYLALTGVEWAGIRFFGQRRGWRTTGQVALVVCAHASVGWILVGPLFFPMAIVVRALGRLWPWLGLGPAAALGGAFFLGMLIFETLVYVGFRRMRYANAPAAASVSIARA